MSDRRVNSKAARWLPGAATVSTLRSPTTTISKREEIAALANDSEIEMV